MGVRKRVIDSEPTRARETTRLPWMNSITAVTMGPSRTRAIMKLCS